MRIGVCQFDMAWEEKKKNQEKIVSLLSSCAQKLDWLILPEMSLTGFSMNPDKTELTEEDIRFFSGLAARHGMFVTFGGVRSKQNRSMTHNAQGSLHAGYAKTHLFSMVKETQYYLPGNQTITCVIHGFRVTPLVCYDLRFANLFWYTAENTDLFVVIANWPTRRVDAWVSLLKARAIENQAFVIGVNRIGNDPHVDYPGKSMVFNPFGGCLLDGEDREGIFTVELQKNDVDEARKSFPVWKDRREDIIFQEPGS